MVSRKRSVNIKLRCTSPTLSVEWAMFVRTAFRRGQPFILN